MTDQPEQKLPESVLLAEMKGQTAHLAKIAAILSFFRVIAIIGIILWGIGVLLSI